MSSATAKAEIGQLRIDTVLDAIYRIPDMPKEEVDRIKLELQKIQNKHGYLSDYSITIGTIFGIFSEQLQNEWTTTDSRSWLSLMDENDLQKECSRMEAFYDYTSRP
jgi:hypothetical protein